MSAEGSSAGWREGFRTVGRSGLVVSPIALGTMTFGTPRWGTDDAGSEAIFNAYVDAGGNFIDTADVYSGGRSEELLGGFIAARRLRDRIVLATKSGWHSGEAGDVNGGGNGRKNIQRALEASLRRLRTDCIDLYWLHVWDMVTPVEEVLQTVGDLVRAGKIRYFGFSNAPAWYVAKAATLAAAHAVPGPIALQLAYSLVERDIEREHLPMAREFGLGLVPWSPLAAGFLAGKYRAPEAGAASGRKASGAGRLAGPNPFGDTLFTEHNWAVLETLRTVASEVGRPMAQVALAWAAARPGVVAPIVGASRLEQLQSSLAACDLVLSPEHRRALDLGSAKPPGHPYSIFEPGVMRSVFGGIEVRGGV